MGALFGKTAIICGGGKDKSIGYGIARALAEQGMNLAVVGASKGKLTAARELEGIYGIRVMPVRMVDPDEELIRKAVQDVASTFGSIDLLANCALVSKAQFVNEISQVDLERCLEACVVVPHLWMKCCYGHLARARGSVLNLVTSADQEGVACLGALGAASAALRALSKAAQLEWEQDGIQVEVVSARARTGQLERWEREYSGETTCAASDSGLASIEDVGLRCAELVLGHATS